MVVVDTTAWERLELPLDSFSLRLPVSPAVSLFVVGSAGMTERAPNAWLVNMSVEPPTDTSAMVSTGTMWLWASVVKDTVFPFTMTAVPVEASEYVVPSTVMGEPPGMRGVLSTIRVGEADTSPLPPELPVVMEPELAWAFRVWESE
jgi:hypothetical protein